MAKLWDKGFEPDKMIEEYTVGDDRELDMRLARYDVEGSLAHIAMLEKIGLLSAGELAVPMFSMQLEGEQAFSKHELIVRNLLSVDTRWASRAAAILSRQGRIRTDRKYRAFSAATRKGTGGQHSELTFLRKQFREFTAAHGEAAPLFSDFSPELVIVVPADSSLSDPGTLMCIACSGLNADLRIGIGPEVDVLHLYDSYAQASSVLQVLRAIPNLGPCSTWEGLGVYGNLTLLTRNHEDAQLPLTPNIAALREEDPALFDTLELFLDNAGSIAKTSEELCIHRSTLYYRLKRIADITGTDLNSGLDRFTLHLELKLFRLTSVLLGDDEPATAPILLPIYLVLLMSVLQNSVFLPFSIGQLPILRHLHP